MYVVDSPDRYKGADVASESIGVVSANEPSRDTNLHHDAAGLFESSVPPLREALTTERFNSGHPYSFVLPMTPRTERGAWRLLEARGEMTLPQEAGAKIAQLVKKRYPLSFYEPQTPMPPVDAPAQLSRPFAPMSSSYSEKRAATLASTKEKASPPTPPGRRRARTWPGT